MSKQYAFCMPGKIGDALYTLPTIQTICERDDAEATFITSEMCRPLERLLLYQDYIVDFVVPPEYIIMGEGQGVQPWEMPVVGEYDKVYQLGYAQCPRGPLHKFSARCAGLETVPDPVYKYPNKKFYSDPYVVVGYCASRGYPPMWDAYRYMIENCPIQVVQTGTMADYIDSPSDNMAELDLLDVLPLLAHAKLFVGFYSGLLVLANGFPELQRIVTLTSKGCGEQHGLHLPNTLEIAYPPPCSHEETRAPRFQEELLNAVFWGVDK
ncbi:MAG: hypothetical protein KOO63_04075 [Bacteroidales bacterium]|nr:hypothetical protein [Candidatus Latescibacterota bacterium]